MEEAGDFWKAQEALGVLSPGFLIPVVAAFVFNHDGKYRVTGGGVDVDGDDGYEGDREEGGDEEEEGGGEVGGREEGQEGDGGGGACVDYMMAPATRDFLAAASKAHAGVMPAARRSAVLLSSGRSAAAAGLVDQHLAAQHPRLALASAAPGN